MAVAFDEAVNYLRPGSSPFHLPVGHLAKRDREGMLQRNIQFPAVLEFRPTVTVQMSPTSNADTWVKFYRLKAEVVMYTIWAKKTKDSLPVQIGELIMESKLLPSKYGDEKLFFQHNIH